MQGCHCAAVLVRVGIEMKRQQDFGNAVSIDVGGVHKDGLGGILCRDDQMRSPIGIFVPADRIGVQAEGGNIGFAIMIEVGGRLGITLPDALGDMVDGKGRCNRRQGRRLSGGEVCATAVPARYRGSAAKASERIKTAIPAQFPRIQISNHRRFSA